MKKRLSFIFALFLLLTGAFAKDISVIVDDNRLQFDVPPTVSEGRTLVPVRGIFESLGASVDWNGETRIVTSSRDDTVVTLTLGDDAMYVNGNKHLLDVPACAVNGRTLVPVRAISEAYGSLVSWNPSISTVHIKSRPKTLISPAEYTGTPYCIVNNNIPYFNIDHYTSDSFEMYVPLDESSRCTYAFAMLGPETMPSSPREDISSVRPTGWLNVKYDIIEGGYLYNRCHLIGFQLSGENANEYNLITGTRYLNVFGMLPFENMVADYINETGNHVLYRVTPAFEGNNLLANGVLMEAMSFEDKGEGICFNVFCFNVQPGVYINYADGSSAFADTASVNETVLYVLNTNSKKFHILTCHMVKRMNDNNRENTNLSRDAICNMGYSPCGVCKP